MGLTSYKEDLSLPLPVDMLAHRVNTAMYAPEGDLTPETDHAGTLVLNFQPPEL